MNWYRERGLTKPVREVLEEDQKFGKLKKGEVFEYEEIIEDYSTGRIDIRNVPGDEYWNGWHEYSVAPMRTEDWNHFGDWLDDFETEELWEFDDIIAKYEQDSGRKIRWADDIWHQCYECWMITDLRETKEHIHKMDCGKNR